MRPSASQKKTFLSLAFVVFLITPIRIWTTEHRARLMAEDSSKPKLRSAIDLVVWGDMNRATMLTIDVSLRNRGASSIARFNKLLVTVDSKEVVAKIIPAPDHDIIVNGANGLPTSILHPEEYLVRRALNNPIPRGGGMTGWMMFVVPGLSKEELSSGKAHLFLQFLDVDGAAVLATQDIKDNRATGNVYLPLGQAPSKQP